MSDTIYHIKIKKEYASAVLEDLNLMEAIEIVEGDTIPEWQQQETLRRLAEFESNPSSGIPMEEAFALLEKDDE